MRVLFELSSGYFITLLHVFDLVFQPASVAQLDARPTGGQEVAGSTPPVGNILSWRFDHEIFSTVILSLSLQLSVSGEECAQYWLTA